MLAIDKHLIPFTGADRHNDSLVISGKPKGGTSQFEMYATMQVVTEEQLPTIAAVRVTEVMPPARIRARSAVGAVSP